MRYLNPLETPIIVYCRALLGVHYERARSAEDRGASAIEWAIITGILAVIALMAGGIIYKTVHKSASNVNTKFDPGD